jgi:hypothetical protein
LLSQASYHPVLTGPRRFLLFFDGESGFSLLFGQAEAIAWDGVDLIITNEAGGILRTGIDRAGSFDLN